MPENQDDGWQTRCLEIRLGTRYQRDLNDWTGRRKLPLYGAFDTATSKISVKPLGSRRYPVPNRSSNDGRFANCHLGFLTSVDVAVCNSMRHLNNLICGSETEGQLCHHFAMYSVQIMATPAIACWRRPEFYAVQFFYRTYTDRKFGALYFKSLVLFAQSHKLRPTLLPMIQCN
jgi:hypothetical protein